MMMKYSLIIFCTVSFFVNGERVSLSHQPEPDHQSEIQWYEWGQEAFNRAQARR